MRRIGEAGFRVALRLLPPAMRSAYGDEMLEVARHRAAALPAGGTRARFWLAEIADLLRASARERFRSNSLSSAGRFEPRKELHSMATTILHDFKLALRLSRRRPGSSFLIVALLALGIGANTAIFSLVHGILLSPLPWHEPDRLVRLWGTWDGGDQARISPPDFLDYRRENEVFTSLAASTSFSPSFTVTGHGEPERVRGALVTSNFFATLGVDAVRGRDFGPPEAEPDGDRAVVLSHGYWQRRFGGDATLIGQTLTVEGEPHTVLGVMPAGFAYPAEPDLWRPMPYDMLHGSKRRFHFFNPVGRMAPGVELQQVRENLNLIAARLEVAYPDSNTSWRVRPVLLTESLLGSASRPLRLLLAAVAILLGIACANVAFLVLSRSLARRREMALRGALGAGGRQLVSQLLIENLTLALSGGALGLLLAHGAIFGLRTMGPGTLPRLADVSISPQVLAFATALSLATGLLFGLAPALHARRLDFTRHLKVGSPSHSVRTARLRGTLVVAQVALSVLLLIGAGLLVKSLGRLLAVDPGFTTSGTLTASLELPRASYAEPEDQRRFLDLLLTGSAAIPGVEAVGITSQLPMMGGGDTYVHPEGQEPASSADRPTAQVRKASPGYFDAMGIPLVSGRSFSRLDGGTSPPTVLINRALLYRDFQDLSAGQVLGRRLVVDLGEVVAAEIIGVVDDIREFGPAHPAPEMIYLSTSQFPEAGLHVVLRTEGDPGVLAGPLQSLVQELDPNLPLSEIASLESLVDRAVAGPLLRVRLLGLFAALALLLAAAGLFGVLSHLVAQRRHEIGVRMALGADRAELLRWVLARGLGLTAIGLLTGVAAAAASTRWLSSFLYEVGTLDPLIFLVAPGILGAVALLASLLPAYRASRIDPLVAFRSE